MIKEEIYCDSNIVLTSFIFSDATSYVRNPTKDPFYVVIPSDCGIKDIITTDEFRDWYVGDDTFKCPNDTIPITTSSLKTQYGLPADTFIAGVGSTDNETAVLFGISSKEQLAALCSSFNTAVPLPETELLILKNNPETIARFVNKDGQCFIEGTIYFDHSGKCTKIEAKKYYQDIIGWETNFKVNVHSNQSVSAVGYEFFRRDEYLYTLDDDTYEVRYVRYDDGDLLIRWKGLWQNKVTGKIEEEIFTSSSWWYSLVNYKFDDCFSGYDLSPSVKYWVCKSERSSTVKLMFYVQNAQMLKDVARYYGVTAPCTEDVFNMLDTNPERFRVRHYDVFGLGPGKWLPLVLGAVVLVDGIPSRIELYERKRWNEA